MGVTVIFILVSGLVGSVVHAGSGVQCLNCHHSHDFPDCLLHYAECKHHEQCIVTKENQNVVMVHCGNIDECYHIHAGQTKMCCITQKCLADQLTNSGGQSTTPLISSNAWTLGCPSHCQHQDYYRCITQAAVCPLGEFCEFEVNEQGVKGRCHSLTSILTCEIEASKHTHCPAHYSLFNKHHCRFCCIDQTCKIVDFLHPTSPRPPTTPPMSTTTSGPTTTKTPTTSAVSSYKCQDNKSDCVTNMATVCKDEAGILQCSQTCGLCAVVQKEYNGTDPCDDQLLHGDCVTYAVTNNMCTNSLAPFLCPHQCGLCGKVMSSLAQKVLNGGTTSTTTTTAVPTTTSPTTTQCVDTLQGMSCASFPNICANAFGPVSCRKFCNLCGVTTTP